MNLRVMIPTFIIGAISTVVIANSLGVGKPSPIPVVPYGVFNPEQVNVPVQTPASLPPLPPLPQNQSLIRVVKTEQVVEPTKDPIWKVELVVDGKITDSVEAIIGRSYRQTANRHVSGNESPLPIGNYRIDKGGIVKERFSNPELGFGYWIPISPLFSTGRSALGIHQDPSWGKTNKESGTSGCIGLKTPEDTAKVVSWVRQFGVSSIVVAS